MSRFDKGVMYYTKGTARVSISFPEDAVMCRYCRFCKVDNLGRYWCRLTERMLYSIEYIPDHCPITIDTTENGEIVLTEKEKSDNDKV